MVSLVFKVWKSAICI